MSFQIEPLIEKLRQLRAQIATAESCTGGLIAKRLTDFDGSSAYFWGSAVCYDNAAKMALVHVQSESLEAFGAVSEVVAREMAAGILAHLREKSTAPLFATLSTTGIAGPTGSTPGKPLGSAWICVAIQRKGAEAAFHARAVQSPFGSDRAKNREFFADSALQLLAELI